MHTRRAVKKRTKSKSRSTISPVWSRDREGSPRSKGYYGWKDLLKKVGFEAGVKEWRMIRVVMTEMGWQVNEEASRDMTWHSLWLFTRSFLTIKLQETQLSQRNREILHVIQCFTKLLKVTQNDTLEKVVKSLLVFCCNYAYISYRFWGIQQQIMAWPWNLGSGSFKVIETCQPWLNPFARIPRPGVGPTLPHGRGRVISASLPSLTRVCVCVGRECCMTAHHQKQM